MRGLGIGAVALIVACQRQPVVEAQSRSGLPQVTQIDSDQVHTILRPDAIQSIDSPLFVRASEATFMRDDEPVVGVVSGGVAKAYSTWHLDHHEIVNDTLGNKPVAVTW